jgi:hypothetical protein
LLSKLRSYRPTHAVVVAYIALFVALGGSSYAAITITGKNVKNSSLTGKDIKNSSLTTSDVKNRSLLSKDFKSGQLPAGPKGDRGLTGLNGSSRGYAAVEAYNSDPPVLIPARTKNFIAVSRASEGVYCLTPVAGLIEGESLSMAAPNYDGSFGTNLFAFGSRNDPQCASGQFTVHTFTLSSGNTVPSDVVNFDLVVP